MLAAILAAEGAPRVAAKRGAVPSFAYPEAAAQALGRTVERAAWLRRSAGVVPDSRSGSTSQPRRAIVDRALDGVEDAWLAPDDTRALLAAYGIPVGR